MNARRRRPWPGISARPRPVATLLRTGSDQAAFAGVETAAGLGAATGASSSATTFVTICCPDCPRQPSIAAVAASVAALNPQGRHPLDGAGPAANYWVAWWLGSTVGLRGGSQSATTFNKVAVFYNLSSAGYSFVEPLRKGKYLGGSHGANPSSPHRPTVIGIACSIRGAASQPSPVAVTAVLVPSGGVAEFRAQIAAACCERSEGPSPLSTSSRCGQCPPLRSRR